MKQKHKIAFCGIFAGSAVDCLIASRRRSCSLIRSSVSGSSEVGTLGTDADDNTPVYRSTAEPASFSLLPSKSAPAPGSLDWADKLTTTLPGDVPG